MKNNILLFLFCWFGILPLKAAQRSVSNYYFFHISIDNGLSQSNVKAILQDSYGFMWFGTKNGLNRYDGTSIVQMDCDDYAAGTGNHNISALFEDKERCLWVGTDRGVYQYYSDIDVFKVVNLKTKDGFDMSNWVSNIVADSVGNIWVVIPDQGIFRYKNEELYLYDVAGNFKTEEPDCICVRQNGEVWVGTWGIGLLRYNPQTDVFDQFGVNRVQNNLEGKNILAICDYGEWIVFALYDGELMKYNPQTDQLIKFDLPEIEHTYVRDLMYFDDELWVGTSEGIYIVNEKLGNTIHLEQDLMCPFSLSDKIIYSIYRDRENGVWLGTMFGGVNYLPHRNLSFENYVPNSSMNSLSTKRIREIVGDNRGNVYIGTEDNGVEILNLSTGKFSRLSPYKGSTDNRQVTLSMSYWDDRIVCGLFKSGLDIIHLSENKVSHYDASHLDIGEGSVYSFFIDNTGCKWIGTGWGLYKALSGDYKFERVDEIGFDWIFDIFQDKDGDLWFASMGNGIWKYNLQKNSFKKYIYEENVKNSLSSNSVSSIMQDSKGRIWISTDRGGICRYNSDTDDFSTFSVDEGLPDDVAYKILEDEQSNLWFGTNRGLVRFNPDTKDIRVYTTKDGLIGNQFNYKSALKGEDGKFYFGTIDGLIAFNPNVSEEINFQPSIYISKFSIFNQEITVHTPNSPLKKCIEQTDKIILSYDQSNISFDVALLSYSTTESNQYDYKLEPLDKDWVKASSNQKISYASLPPGNYILHVRGTNGIKDGVYVTRSLAIIILPPWWRSSIAYILYAIFGVSGVLCWFFWYKNLKDKQMKEKQNLYKMEKEKELYESKVTFFTEIAHEVRTPLTLINGPLEAIGEMNITNEKLKKNLNVIGQNTKRLLNLAEQLL
ncbi:MAG: hybrid sensor histidine kinase/response regulator, partial [Prevotella sp.]|nr:hybrid sensor histidine kinase/response regulator [Prevotella sp.]